MSRKVPNVVGLVKYLKSLGIDANRVPASSVTELGYEYLPDVHENDGKLRLRDQGGRLTFDRANLEWREWPSPDVYEKVVQFQSGAAYDVVIPLEKIPEKVEPPKEPVKAEPKKVEK